IVGEREIIEVQIRTEEMHRESEYGVASHLSYKQKQTGGGWSPTQNRLCVMELIPSLFRPLSWRASRKKPAEGATEHRPEVYDKEQVPRWVQELAEAHKDAHSDLEFVDD